MQFFFLLICTNIALNYNRPDTISRPKLDNSWYILFRQEFNDKVVITRSLVQYRQIISSFLIFSCYLTRLKAREISCKIWETRKIFRILQSAPCDNNYVSLNRQFTVVLNSIIFFPAIFCDNSLLVLKMRFQVFSSKSKRMQGSSSDRKILMFLLSVLFHLQNHVAFFEILICSQDIWGNVHYALEINLIS